MLENVNQLVVATVTGSQAGELTDELVRAGFYVTQIDSSGGILHEATVSLLIGLDRADMPRLLEHFRACCSSRRQFVPAHVEGPFPQVQPIMVEVEWGGAVIYAFDVERFEQF